MKKTVLKGFAVWLALVMLLSLASCGGRDPDTSETTGASSAAETEKQETAGTTESELLTEQDDQAPTVTAGAETNGKDGSAKPGGKDTGKDPGKTENEKQTGENTSETSKPSGGKTKETTSAFEPEEKDNEGEFVIPPKEIQLPVVEIR